MPSTGNAFNNIDPVGANRSVLCAEIRRYARDTSRAEQGERDAELVQTCNVARGQTNAVYTLTEARTRSKDLISRHCVHEHRRSRCMLPFSCGVLRW